MSLRWMTLALLAGLGPTPLPTVQAAAPGPPGASSTIALRPTSADTTLADLAARLRAHPGDQGAAKALRLRARRAGQLDSAITILKGILASHPETQPLRMQLALAHIDRLPAPPALDLRAQAVIASQAIRLFDAVIAAEPEQWGPRYASAMTDLLFPLPTRHYKPAVEKLQKLLELQRTLPPTPHFASGFVALGDALILDFQTEAARTWWQVGKKAFPADPELAARIAIPPDELLSTITAKYGFDRPFQTDCECLELAPR